MREIIPFRVVARVPAAMPLDADAAASFDRRGGRNGQGERGMGEFGFGQSVRRKEDVRLLTGRGCFIEDRDLPGQAHAALLRSPHAHAEIVAIDAAEALTLPGVLAVLTGADLTADRIGTIPATFKPPVFPGSPPETPIVEPPYPALARDRVRFVGDPVALVVAETREQAR